jgi:hypothetical protein
MARGEKNDFTLDYHLVTGPVWPHEFHPGSILDNSLCMYIDNQETLPWDRVRYPPQQI